MNDERLRAEWARLAPAWIREVREGRNATGVGLLDHYMLQACGEVRGFCILDSGCGEGRFSRMLLEKGAESVLGLDSCEEMIEAARELSTGRDVYHVADVQNLGCLAEASCDVAVSYLNQCDLPAFDANTEDVFRVLRPGGRFIIANLHPMRSAVGGWQKTPSGAKEHVILDRYFDEGERRWSMMGVDFTNFHRTLSTYVQAYLSAGFIIEQIVEPTMDSENLAQYPELDDEVRVPNFIIFRLRKPERQAGLRLR